MICFALEILKFVVSHFNFDEKCLNNFVLILLYSVLFFVRESDVKWLPESLDTSPHSRFIHEKFVKCSLTYGKESYA